MRLIVFFFSIMVFIIASGFVVDSKVAIVINKNAVAEEKFAAEEIQNYLLKITEVKVPIVTDISDNTSCVIKLLYDNDLSGEEWKIDSNSKELNISGGKPRGLLYGVYDFLEKYGKVRWLDEKYEIVPANNNFNIPENISIKDKPDFIWRELYDYAFRDYDRYFKFRTRLKLNRNPGLPAKYGESFLLGSPKAAHSMYIYTQDAPLEYCYMNKAGKRVRALNGIGPGNVCFSNLKARDYFADQLACYIKNDRIAAEKQRKSFPLYYDISVNDNAESCYCPDCKDIAEKYGTAFLAIDFINEIAKKIEKVYPDVFVETLIYGCMDVDAVDVPVNFKLNKNVVLRIAQLGPDFGHNGKIKDTIRPINHPLNRSAYDKFKIWSDNASTVFLWDYIVLFRESFMSPYVNLKKTGEHFRTYRDLKVKGAFIEAENFSLSDKNIPVYTSFMALRNYLYAKTMEKNDANSDKIIKEFIKDYYGSASVEMMDYFNALEDKTSEVDGIVVKTHVSRRPCMNMNFLLKMNDLFDKAEDKVKDQQIHLNHVKIERIMLDSAFLNLYENFEKKHDFKEKFKLSKQQLFDRFIANIDIAGDLYYPENKWKEIRQNFIDYIHSAHFRTPLPTQFQNARVIDWIYSSMDIGLCTIEKDFDAVEKHALSPSPKYGSIAPDKFHKNVLSFGVYDASIKKNVANITVPADKLPQDEKYHWYNIGIIQPTDTMRIWGHWSWHFGQSLKPIFNPIAPDIKYDIYISVKVQGPTYVLNSHKKDAMLIDRVVFVEIK